MLYPKNKQAFSDELFKNPSAEYRGTPFWSWNCKPDKQLIEEQIEHFKEMGFGGAHIHARTGLDVAYLSDEFMELVQTAADKLEAENMLTWLYDEDRWSSGPAGGKVTQYKPYRRKRLMVFPEDQGWNTPKEKALQAGEPYLLACYDISLDDEGYLQQFKRVDRQDKADGQRWYAYVVNERESTWFNGQTYIDAMDGEAVQSFIDITYKRYAEYLSDRFGKTVPAIFTDEPNANHEKSCVIPDPFYQGRILYGWSRFFEEEYKKAYGSDILDELPLLFWLTENRSDAVVKYKYFDLTGRLFSQNFCGKIGDWCRENGIAFTGHLLREPSLEEQAITSGECMRNYGKFDIPGIDILCDRTEFTTAKQAQSAVHQYGKEGMLSELYGVTGWDYDFRGYKFQGDWQAALGVSVRVPHLAWMSMQGEAKRDYPAAIGYQSPWYREYAQLENHFARVNTLLTRGKPIVEIGVIHPVESAWICMGPSSQTDGRLRTLEENFKAVTNWMLDSHLDFDYICESTLPELAGDNPLAVGEMAYRAVVVPDCISLRGSTIAFLNRFQKAGGKVIFMGACPAFSDGVPGDACAALYRESEKIPFAKAALNDALAPFRLVDIRRSNGKTEEDLIYNYRSDGAKRYLFAARKTYPGKTENRDCQNDVLEPEDITLVLDGEFSVRRLDTMTGAITPCACTAERGKTTVRVVLHGYDSLLLELSEPAQKITLPPKQPLQETARFDLRRPVSFSLSEPNVLLLDQAEFAIDDEPWQPREELLRADSILREQLDYPSRTGHRAQPYTMEKVPEEHTLRLRFHIESEIDIADACLALEDAECTRIVLNGREVKNQVNGYFTDRSIGCVPLPELHAGQNELILEKPYGARTDVEWCYILGSFGVRVSGSLCTLTRMPEVLSFGDITTQGLPFYGGNIHYEIPFEMPFDGFFKVHAPAYRGAMIGVEADGKRAGSIIFPPYDLTVPACAGRHTLRLTLFGNRQNCFGCLHNADTAQRYISPAVWRTKGDAWCYEYRLRAIGILKSPDFSVLRADL